MDREVALSAGVDPLVVEPVLVEAVEQVEAALEPVVEPRLRSTPAPSPSAAWTEER